MRVLLALTATLLLVPPATAAPMSDAQLRRSCWAEAGYNAERLSNNRALLGRMTPQIDACVVRKRAQGK